MARLAAMLARARPRRSRRSRISRRTSGPTCFSTGPPQREQMEGLKRLVRDAGRAGIPVHRLQFLDRRRLGLACPADRPRRCRHRRLRHGRLRPGRPIPDGMVWNMRYRPGSHGAPPLTVVRRRSSGSASSASSTSSCRSPRRPASGSPPIRTTRRRSASRHRAAGQRPAEIRPPARHRRQPGERARVLHRLARRRCRTATSTRRRATSRAAARSPTSISAMSRGKVPRLSRDLRRRRRHRHDRDRAHPARRGL